LSTHHHKTVHLNLDNEGDVIVSEGVWNIDLKDRPDLPFTYEADVKNPPPLVISMGDPVEQRDVIAHLYEGRR